MEAGLFSILAAIALFGSLFRDLHGAVPHSTGKHQARTASPTCKTGLSPSQATSHAKKRFAALGVEPLNLTPAPLADLVRSEPAAARSVLA